jgi:virginiamycin B lyase
MSQRPLLFVVMAACLLSGVPVWCQTRLHDGSRKDAAEALNADRHEREHNKWRNVTESMPNLRALSQNRTLMASGYLAQNAFEKAKPAAAGAPEESVEVSIKEWPVPTPGSHPHDPLATPDGSIWYTGQMANLLGRLNPRTGEFTEYQLKTPGSGPHGLVSDANGNIWFTANFKGYIGNLDPKTGAISEYPMPDAKARDPHTLVFGQKGIRDEGFGRRIRTVPAAFEILEASFQAAHEEERAGAVVARVRIAGLMFQGLVEID